MKIVEILWNDAIASSAEEWIEPKDIKNKPMPSKSVGYLMKEDDVAVTIAALKNQNHVAATITIPRGMIKKMREL